MDLKYIPFYVDWVELMRTKDTLEKQLAFINGIFDYAMSGSIAPSPLAIEHPTGVDYARRDGYLVSRAQLDFMLPRIQGGSAGRGVSRNKGNSAASKKNHETAVYAQSIPQEGFEGEIPSYIPTKDEQIELARQCKVPISFLEEFILSIEKMGWGYNNSHGVFVSLNRRNFKAVLSSFYRQAQKNKEKDKQTIGVNLDVPQDYTIRI